MSDTPAIYTALAAVMADVQAVAKRDRNDHQNFMFRGIDAVMNAVGPALRDHGVIVVPQTTAVTYEGVTTSTGKPATACRVQVSYLFYAPDGSHIETSVAGEAWDSGDKACPKAMSVAFRTALLQALCLPTDEPDPDSHSYQRSAVDLTELRRTIAAARAREIEGDYDGTLEWAAEAQQNANAAVRRLQKAIDKFDAADEAAEETGTEDEAPTNEAGEDDTQAGPAASSSPSGDTDTPGTPEGGTTPSAGDGSESSPAPTTWRLQAEAEGLSDQQVLIALHGKGVWPADDQGAKPRKTEHLDAAAERHPDLFASVIERLAQDARQKASA